MHVWANKTQCMHAAHGSDRRHASADHLPLDMGHDVVPVCWSQSFPRAEQIGLSDKLLKSWLWGIKSLGIDVSHLHNVDSNSLKSSQVTLPSLTNPRWTLSVLNWSDWTMTPPLMLKWNPSLKIWSVEGVEVMIWVNRAWATLAQAHHRILPGGRVGTHTSLKPGRPFTWGYNDTGMKGSYR